MAAAYSKRKRRRRGPEDEYVAKDLRSVADTFDEALEKLHYAAPAC
jgi:hypothetical protein